MITRRCRRGNSKWELVEKKRPTECEHEQRTEEGGGQKGRWTLLMLSTDRKSAELTPSVNEPQRRRGYTELLERRAKISVETTEG